MALALYDNTSYKFGLDKVKVLKGGWLAWQEKNSTDPKSYPVEP